MDFGFGSPKFFSQLCQYLRGRSHGWKKAIPFVELASEGSLFFDQDGLQPQFVQRNGGLHASDTSAAPVAGVFVNNIRGSKLDWFLNKDVTVGTGKRNSDGSWSYPVTVTLSSVMSEEEEESLPLYVAGVGRQASDWNDERLTVLLYAPAGGTISDVETSGSAAFSTAPEEHGRLKK